MNRNYFDNKGAIALPTILMLASMLLAVGLAMNLSSNNKIEAIKNSENALNAFYIAEAGIKDATEKIARDKNFSSNYTLALGAGTAQVTITATPPSIVIESKGVYGGNAKTVQLTINVDDDGKILPDNSWNEL